MRSVEKIEAEILEIKRRIIEKQRLDNISKFAGAEDLTAVLVDAKEFYEQAIRALDENSPVLSKEYGKNKACLALVNGLISGLQSSEKDLFTLKATFLERNEELQNVQEEIKNKEKNLF